MATKFHKIKGKLKFTKNLFEPDTYLGNTNYVCNVYDINEADWNAAGVRTRPYVDKEGTKLYKLKRPHSKNIKGEVVEFGPPEVKMADGSDVEQGKIGYGSEAEIEFITYDTGAGKGHRLNKVTITNLIEYVPEENPGVDLDELD